MLYDLDDFEGPKIVVIVIPDSVQPGIHVGQLSTARWNPGYLPTLIAHHVLRGASGRLMERQDVQPGPTYGGSETIIRRKGPRWLNALNETRNEITGNAFGLGLDEIERLCPQRVPANAPRRVKVLVIGSFP